VWYVPRLRERVCRLCVYGGTAPSDTVSSDEQAVVTGSAEVVQDT